MNQSSYFSQEYSVEDSVKYYQTENIAIDNSTPESEVLTIGGANDEVSRKLRDYLPVPEIALLHETMRNNGGDGQFAFENAHIIQNAKIQQFKKLRPVCQTQVKNQMRNAKLKENIDELFKNFVQNAINTLESIKFDGNFLLQCLKSNIDGKFTELARQLGKQFSNTCQGGRTNGSLIQQLSKLMQILLPMIKDRKPFIDKILQTRSFNHFKDLKQANDEQKKRFIVYVQNLPSYQDFILYGKDMRSLSNSFVIAVIKKLIQVSQSWSECIYIVQRLYVNPHHDFSDCSTLTASMKAFIYKQIYNLKQFKDFEDAKGIPESLANKQKRDIGLIIAEVNEQSGLRLLEQEKIKNYLQSYDYLKFYCDNKVGVNNMLHMYNFIQQNCKNYLKLNDRQKSANQENKSKKSIESERARIIKGLRNFLMELKVPFDSHNRIEQLVFENKKYQLLDQSLSNEQKKQLISWIYKEMDQYYNSEFDSLPIAQKTRQKLESIIIRLDMKVSYEAIHSIIKTILEQKNDRILRTSHQFSPAQLKKIRQALKDCEELKKYINNFGVDYDKEKAAAQRILFFLIMIPNQIGCLHSRTVQTFVAAYLNSPTPETLRSANLTPQNKEEVIKLIKINDDLKKFQQKMKNYLIDRAVEDYRLRLKKELKQLDNNSFEKCWKALLKRGKFNFQDNGELKIEEQQEDLLQLKDELDQQSLKVLNEETQNYPEYHAFKYNYPTLLERQINFAQENLRTKVQEQLERAGVDDDIITGVKKSLQTSKFNIENLEKKYNKYKNQILGMQEYRQLMDIKAINEGQQEFIKAIEVEKNLVKILQGKDFSKYTEQEKEDILVSYRSHPDVFLYETDILTEKDKRMLENQMFGEQQKNVCLQTPPKKQVSPEKLKTTSNNKQSKLSQNKASGKKLVTVQQWKQSIAKKANKKYDELIGNLELTQVAGEQLTNYENKLQILAQYQTRLNALKTDTQDKYTNLFLSNDESNLGSILKEYKENRNQFWSDLNWGNPQCLFENLKTKWKMSNPKFNKLIAETNAPEKTNQITRIRKIMEELENVSQLKS